jgi:hypothetical protein
MEDRERKRVKLNVHAPKKEQFDALRATGLNITECRKVIVSLQEDDSGKRTAQRTKDAYSQAFPLYKPLRLQAANSGDIVEFPMMNLPLLLQAKVDACPLYREMLRTVMRSYGDRLTLLFYCDEVSGGNVLSALQSRKSNLCYVSWLQCPLLFQENMWLTLSVAKSSCIQTLSHGMTELIRSILESLKEETQNGIAITLGEEAPRLLWIDRVVVIADAEAIRSSTGAKGASGLKPCVQCLNVLQLGKAHGVTDHVDITSMDPATWWPQTTATIQEAADTLRAAGGIGKTQEMEKFLGWNFANLVHGPLQSLKLADWVSIDGFLYDAMHIMWSNGLVCQEVGLWYNRLIKTTSTTSQHLQQYAALWCRNVGTATEHLPCPSQLFSSKLLKEDQDYKGDALYTSAILPICVAFSDEVLDDDVDEMQMANASLRALQRVAACLWSLKVSTENLQSLLPLQQDHLRCHILAYTAAHMRPKAHYGLHLSAQIEKMNKVIDCFCCERKHKAYKGLAQKTFFAPYFARSCLLEMVTKELSSPMDASTLSIGFTATSKKKILPGCPTQAQCANGLQVHGIKYVKKQFLQLTNTCAVQIQEAVLWKEQFFLRVKVFHACAYTNVGRSAWKMAEGPITLLPINDVKPLNRVMFHRMDENGKLWLMS